MEHGAHGVITIDGGDTDHCLGDPRHKPPSFCVDWQICLPGYHHSSGGVIGALGELEPCRQVPRVLSWGDRIDIPPLSRRHAETRITPWLRHGGVPIGRLGFRQRERETPQSEKSRVLRADQNHKSYSPGPWHSNRTTSPLPGIFQNKKASLLGQGYQGNTAQTYKQPKVHGQYSPNPQTVKSGSFSYSSSSFSRKAELY
jgi:hypothetical protein